MKAYDVHSNAVIVAREEGREEGEKVATYALSLLIYLKENN